MKYELKATGRIFLPMFGALLIVAAITRLFTSLSYQTPQIIGIVVSVIMIIGILVMTLLLTIQRFYKNLLGNEGYLMFTLPVSTDSLIFSKLLVAGFWNILSTLVVFAAISIMAMTGITLREALEALREFLKHLNHPDLRLTLFLLESIATVLLSMFSGILTLYACMALSLLFNKHRGLFAFGAFIVINILLQTVGSFLYMAADAAQVGETYLRMQLQLQIHTGLGVMIVSNLILCVLFYFVTKLMLKHKLNLE